MTGSHAVVIGDVGVPLVTFYPTGSAVANVVLTRANDYNGGTLLNSGGLTFANDQALGTGPLNFGGAFLQPSGGTRTLANPVVLGTGGSLRVSGSNNITFTGTVDLGGGTRTINLGSGTATFTNVISGGSLVLNSATVVFTGNNTFNGN